MYRSLDLDSYSTVKAFLDDRKKYYRKYVLKEKVNENATQESDDMRFGSVVDTLLLTPLEFDTKYTIATATKPSGQMEDFVNNMVKLTLASSNEMGDLTRSIESIMEESYELLVKNSANGKLRDSLEKFKERFLIKKEGYDFYFELRERGEKVLITPGELDQANNVVEYLINHPYTRDLLNMITSSRYEVISQKMILGEISGLPMKMMSDRIIIDHDDKSIIPWDLKVMGNIDIFSYNYLKLRYYLQLGVYTTLLRQEYPTYAVEPLRFLKVDKYRYMDPLKVKTSEQHYNDALLGFTINGRRYTGLLEAIEDIKFHKNNGIWTSSREAQEGKGLIDLKLSEQYDEQT